MFDKPDFVSGLLFCEMKIKKFKKGIDKSDFCGIIITVMIIIIVFGGDQMAQQKHSDKRDKLIELLKSTKSHLFQFKARVPEYKPCNCLSKFETACRQRNDSSA